MAKPKNRAYSSYSLEAAELLGKLIRQARIEQRIKSQALADRIGVSRGLIQRIERGDTGCAIGVVLEAAMVVGIRLFDAEPNDLSRRMGDTRRTLTLLPKKVRSPTAVKDDF